MYGYFLLSFFTLGGITSVLLGASDQAIKQLAPGINTKLELHPEADRLEMLHRTKQIASYVSLQLPGVQAADLGQLAATLDGKPLTLKYENGWLHIYNTNAGWLFDWPSGRPVVLAAKGNVAPDLKIRNWVVHTQSDPEDNLFSAQVREWVFWVWIVGTGMAIVTGVLGSPKAYNELLEQLRKLRQSTPDPKPAPAPDPGDLPRFCVSHFIDHIQGKTDVLTGEYRMILRGILLEGKGKDEVYAALTGKKRDKDEKWIKANKFFRERHAAFLSKMGDF